MQSRWFHKANQSRLELGSSSVSVGIQWGNINASSYSLRLPHTRLSFDCRLGFFDLDLSLLSPQVRPHKFLVLIYSPKTSKFLLSNILSLITEYADTILSSSSKLTDLLLRRAPNHLHPPAEGIIALSAKEVDVVLELQLEHEVLVDAVLLGGRGHCVA